MEGGGEGIGEVMRVLVVDDSPVERKVVELLLKKSSTRAATFHVTAVDSGKKAMELLGLKEGKLQSSSPPDEQTIDIVLTDYCMPEMTGYDLLKAIKELSSPKPIPVIVMSSENEPQRISRCLTAGAEDFIVKPLQTEDVQRLRNCSNPKQKELQCETGTKRELPTDGKISPERRAYLAGVAMVLNTSSTELSHYFPFLFKFVLLAYAILCLSELLHRWSSSCFSLWYA